MGRIEDSLPGILIHLVNFVGFLRSLYLTSPRISNINRQKIGKK